MKERKEIEQDFHEFKNGVRQEIYLQVLLDIRDLLIDIKKQSEEQVCW